MFRAAGYYFVGLLALVILAFWKTYVVRPTAFDIYTHVHAALMVGWFALLIAQPFLARGPRRPLHRALGRLSYGLVPLLIVSILLLAHARTRAVPSDALPAVAKFFFLPFGMSILFAVPWGLAIVHRREVGLHARYMIATGLAVLDPICGRIVAFYFPPLPDPTLPTLVSYLVTVVILVTLIVRERAQRAGRQAFPRILVLATIVYASFFTFARTGPWLAFIRWFRELPLT